MLAIKPTRFRQRRQPAASTRRAPRIDPLSSSTVPIRVVTVHESTQAATDRTVECPACQKLFRETAVVKDAPFYSPEDGEFVRLLRLYCDHCDVIHMHTRACNTNGDNLGRVVDTAVLRGSAQIERFLRVHPEARGIEQSVGSILPMPPRKEN